MASTSRSVCSHHGAGRQAAAAAQPAAVSSAGRISARSWPASVEMPAAASSSPSRGPTAMTSSARMLGRTLRSRGSRSASNSRSASPSSQSATSPVGDARGGHASSCPSTKSRPGCSRSACSAASAPRITEQSPPASSGKCLRARAARTASRTPSIMTISASSASRPDGPRRGWGAGSVRSPASVKPGRLASTAVSPRSRSTPGALATPSAVPLEFVGTPISSTSCGITRCRLLSHVDAAKGGYLRPAQRGRPHRGQPFPSRPDDRDLALASFDGRG